MTMRRWLPRWTMAAPAMLWWAAFFIVPLGSIVYYSLGVKPADPGAGPVDLSVLSLANYAKAMSDVFFTVFKITMRTAGLGTIACALVGFPVAYVLARYIQPRWKPVLLFLLVLPFWISFLLRTFAWRIILAPEGVLSHFLQDIGLLAGPLTMLDTNAAVQLGIIYNYLPLMVLPMFVALDRIDPALIQGSMDLGAGPIRTFLSVTLPLALPGVLGGLVLTFILASGDYVVPAILGGAKGLMIGNLVATQILAAQNLPLGSAMAVLLILMIGGIVITTAIAIHILRRLLKLLAGPALDDHGEDPGTTAAPPRALAAGRA
jgi:spermidine/putrescine transport system permease protein